MRKPRKNYSPTEKVAILRRHLIDKVPVSDLCDEHRLQPTVFYAWQRQFFENGAAAFERKASSAETEHQRTIAALREKLRRKDEVVSELMEEHVQLKKGLGGL
jgi:transposase